MVVAGKEELQSFNYVFSTRSKQNLFDGHIWLSVVTRPARSSFTRVQRLTACLAILFSTMLANIISFSWRISVSPEEDTILLTIGPYKMISYALTMGILSAIIATPVNLIVVVLFSKRKIRINDASKKTHMSQKKYSIPETIKVRCNDEDKAEQVVDENEKYFNVLFSFVLYLFKKNYFRFVFRVI